MVMANLRNAAAVFIALFSHLSRWRVGSFPDPSKHAIQRHQPPKNGEARSLALSPSAVTVLRQWRRLLASRDLNAVKPGAWVFPFDSDLSRPRNPRSVSEMFTHRVTWALAALGEAKLPGLHLRGIRHRPDHPTPHDGQTRCTPARDGDLQLATGTDFYLATRHK